MLHITTPTVTLTDGEHSVLEAGWLGLIEYRADQTFTRMELGQRIDCTDTANAMVARGYLTKPDATLTQDGFNAIGIKTAAQILTLDMNDTYDGLIVAGRSWSFEQSQAAKAAVGIGPSFEDYEKALGTPVSILLTSDGRGHNERGWCACGDNAADSDWIRYERWTAKGREAHGFLDRKCRKLLQAG